MHVQQLCHEQLQPHLLQRLRQSVDGMLWHIMLQAQLHNCVLCQRGAWCHNKLLLGAFPGLKQRLQQRD